MRFEKYYWEINAFLTDEDRILLRDLDQVMNFLRQKSFDDNQDDFISWHFSEASRDLRYLADHRVGRIRDLNNIITVIEIGINLVETASFFVDPSVKKDLRRISNSIYEALNYMETH